MQRHHPVNSSTRGLVSREQCSTAPAAHVTAHHAGRCCCFQPLLWTRASCTRCLQAELLGNETLQTGLADLASEAAGRNVSYPLAFRTPAGSPAVNTQAGGSTSDGEVTPVRLLMHLVDMQTLPVQPLLPLSEQMPPVLHAACCSRCTSCFSRLMPRCACAHLLP